MKKEFFRIFLKKMKKSTKNDFLIKIFLTCIMLYTYYEKRQRKTTFFLKKKKCPLSIKKAG